ncbi:hypothetical protein ES703_121553 [subsurface metagenome]
MPIENKKPTESSFRSLGRQMIFTNGSELTIRSTGLSIRTISLISDLSSFLILVIFTGRLNIDSPYL